MKIDKIDSEKSFDYENGFLLPSEPIRIQKWITHYNLYCKIASLPGDVVEAGVYKGSSLIRFLTYRDMHENPLSRKILGFDAFGQFPITESFSKNDKDFVKKFSAAGGNGIEVEKLEKWLNHTSIYCIGKIHFLVLSNLLFG